MTNSPSKVIIVGAGPVGLWLAGELRLAGVETTVLERTAARSPFTRGLGMHARTLEVLAMRSAATVPLAAGRRMPKWHFGMLSSLLDFSVLDTEYPFVLAYPQPLLEDLLERRAVGLGATVLRGHTVTGIAQDETGGAVTVTASVATDLADAAGSESQNRGTGTEPGDGSAVMFDAAFVVGCDGAGSTVRKAAGIAFPGTDSTFFGYLADVTLDNPPELATVSAFSPGGALIVAPLPGGRYRVAGFDPAEQDPDTVLTEERLRASVTRATDGNDFGLRDATWLSRFGSAARQAERYRAGRVLLAGDAAHMHFPTGGVGLNVGIQDAMNLGWKLAAVVQGRAPQALLDSYQAERHPIGTALLENTLAQTALIATFTPEGLALRTYLSRLLDATPALSARLAGDLSGLDIAYAPADPHAHPLTGRRAPNLPLGEADLFETMRDARAVLLDFTGTETGSGSGVANAAAQHAAQRGIAVRAAEPWPGHEKTAAALIRPDGFVAWATDDASDGDAFVAALNEFGVTFDTGSANAQ
jgi:2-polyprenyl-6-methoxyphenol hydroxylase-like FAD-dependent oxidoreductase